MKHKIFFIIFVLLVISIIPSLYGTQQDGTNVTYKEYGPNWRDIENPDNTITREFFSYDIALPDKQNQNKYVPFENFTSLSKKSKGQDDYLELKWYNKSVVLEPYIIVSGNERKVPQSVKMSTNITNPFGIYKWKHGFIQNPNFEAFGYYITTENVTCNVEDLSLVCDEQRISFQDVYESFLQQENISADNITGKVSHSKKKNSFIVNSSEFMINLTDNNILINKQNILELDPVIQLDYNTGMKDTYIGTSSYQNYGLSPQLKINLKTSTTNQKALMWFNISSIPSEANITDAYLHVHSSTTDSEQYSRNLSVHEVLHYWEEGTGDVSGVGDTNGSNFYERYYQDDTNDGNTPFSNTDADWEQAGLGLGLDINTSVEGSFTKNWGVGGTGLSDGGNFTIVDLVKKWVNDPINHPNNGLTFINRTLAQVTFMSKDTPTLSYRPILYVTYKVDDITIVYPLNVTYNKTITEFNYTFDGETLTTCKYSLNNGATNTTTICGQNVTGLTSAEGTNTWHIWSSNATYEANRNVTFFVDAVFPLIEFSSVGGAKPNDSWWSLTDTLSINFTITELNPRNITKSIMNATGSFLTYTQTIISQDDSNNMSLIIWTQPDGNNISIPDGTYYINATVVDVASNSNTTETRIYYLDNTTPSLTFNDSSPANNSFLTKNNIFLNMTVIEANASNITFKLYNITGEVNTTIYDMVDSTSNLTINWTDLPEGNYTFNVTIKDKARNKNTTMQRYVTMDSEYPQLNITAPMNITYNSYTANTSNITQMNYTLSGTTKICKYSTDGGLTNTTIPCGTNITNLAYVEGTNIWDVWAEDFIAQVNHSNVTFFVDTLIPTITIDSPLIGTYSTTAIDYNITIDENTHNCSFALKDGYVTDMGGTINMSMGNTSSTTFEYRNTSMENGQYSIQFYCNDTADNFNKSDIVWFAVSSAPPTISLESPLTGTTILNGTDMYFNFTATSGVAIDNCTLFGNWTGAWHSNQSNLTIVSGVSTFFMVNLTQGYYYLWNVWCHDTDGNYNFSEQGNQTIYIEAIDPPSVVITAPINGSNKYQYTNISIRAVVSDAYPIGTVYANVTYGTFQENVTMPLSPSGPFYEGWLYITNYTTYEINVIANNTLGSTNNSERVFINVTCAPPPGGYWYAYNMTCNINSMSRNVSTIEMINSSIIFNGSNINITNMLNMTDSLSNFTINQSTFIITNISTYGNISFLNSTIRYDRNVTFNNGTFYSFGSTHKVNVTNGSGFYFGGNSSILFIKLSNITAVNSIFLFNMNNSGMRDAFAFAFSESYLSDAYQGFRAYDGGLNATNNNFSCSRTCTNNLYLRELTDDNYYINNNTFSADAPYNMILYNTSRTYVNISSNTFNKAIYLKDNITGITFYNNKIYGRLSLTGNNSILYNITLDNNLFNDSTSSEENLYLSNTTNLTMRYNSFDNGSLSIGTNNIGLIIKNNTFFDWSNPHVNIWGSNKNIWFYSNTFETTYITLNENYDIYLDDTNNVSGEQIQYYSCYFYGRDYTIQNKNVSISGTYEGRMNIYNCNNVTIKNNNLTSPDPYSLRTLYLWNVTNSTIFNNTFYINYTTNVLMDYGKNNLILDNCSFIHIDSNNLTHSYIKITKTSGYNTIENNLLTNDSSITISDITNGTRIINNSLDATLTILGTSSDLPIYNTTLLNNNITDTLQIENANYTLVENNTIGNILSQTYSRYNSILRNNVTKGYDVELLLELSDTTDTLVKDNTLKNFNNNNAIELDSSLASVCNNISIINNTIKNGTNIGYTSGGINIKYANNVSIINNTIVNMTGTFPSAIFLTYSSSKNSTNIVIENNNIINCQNGIAYWGINGPQNITTRNNYIYNTSGIGIAFIDSRDLWVIDTRIDNVSEGVLSYTGSNTNTILNVSITNYTTSDTSTFEGELRRNWYIQAFVNDTHDENMSGANVSYYNRTNNFQTYNFTNSIGYTNITNLTQYVHLSTGKQYYTNLIANATKSGWNSNITSFNLTTNMIVYIRMSEYASGPPTSGTGTGGGGGGGGTLGQIITGILCEEDKSCPDVCKDDKWVYRNGECTANNFCSFGELYECPTRCLKGRCVDCTPCDNKCLIEGNVNVWLHDADCQFASCAYQTDDCYWRCDATKGCLCKADKEQAENPMQCCSGLMINGLCENNSLLNVSYMIIPSKFDIKVSIGKEKKENLSITNLNQNQDIYVKTMYSTKMVDIAPLVYTLGSSESKEVKLEFKADTIESSKRGVINFVVQQGNQVSFKPIPYNITTVKCLMNGRPSDDSVLCCSGLAEGGKCMPNKQDYTQWVLLWLIIIAIIMTLIGVYIMNRKDRRGSPTGA